MTLSAGPSGFLGRLENSQSLPLPSERRSQRMQAATCVGAAADELQHTLKTTKETSSLSTGAPRSADVLGETQPSRRRGVSWAAGKKMPLKLPHKTSLNTLETGGN